MDLDMGLDLYCLLVIIIVCALCWKWYDDEGVSTQKASASSHSEGADDSSKVNIQTT